MKEVCGLWIEYSTNCAGDRSIVGWLAVAMQWKPLNVWSKWGPIGCSGLCGCISASRSRGLLEDALTQFADCHFPKNELPPKLFDLVFDFYFHWRPIAVQRRLRAFNAGALCRDFAGFVRSSWPNEARTCQPKACVRRASFGAAWSLVHPHLLTKGDRNCRGVVHSQIEYTNFKS